jgi:hypothetical protein
MMRGKPAVGAVTAPAAGDDVHLDAPDTPADALTCYFLEEL